MYDPLESPEAIGRPQGGVQITEKITLSRDGDSCDGTFTLHAYDTSGNAKRITTKTAFTDLL
jgi:hypothetical protein